MPFSLFSTRKSLLLSKKRRKAARKKQQSRKKAASSSSSSSKKASSSSSSSKVYVTGQHKLRSGRIQFKGRRGSWKPRRGCGCGSA